MRFKFTKLVIVTVTGVLSLGGFTTVVASNERHSETPKAEYYRYVMPDGRTEVGRLVPPEAVDKGYEELDGRMRLIRRIRPALTEAEIAIKQQQQAQKTADEKLKQIFATSEDAELDRDRKMSSFDVIINISIGNIARLNQEYETLAAVAATKLRKGELVPEYVKSNMASVERQIQDAQAHIKLKESERKVLYDSYQPDIDRLKELERFSYF